jgi:predicted kinase
VKSGILNQIKKQIKDKKAILLCGLPGSGKSTIAREMNKFLQGKIYSSDQIRAEMFAEERFNAKGDEHNMSIRDDYYGELIKRALKSLSSGERVIVDASNMGGNRNKIINAFLKVVKDDQLVILTVKTPKNVIAKRMRQEKGMANGKEDVFTAWKRIYGYFEKKLANQEFSWPENSRITVININNLKEDINEV